MGRTVSKASGYAPEEDEFDPQIDDFVSKERKYLHFDLPLNEEQRGKLSFSAHDLRHHSFWPLLAFEDVERRMRKNDQGQTTFEEKKRPIKFASHSDAALLEWYSKFLGEIYEGHLSKRPISNAILAYRGGVGNNITHAKALFDEITNRGDCTAIAVDVSGFFDNINHASLKENLCRILRVQKLSEHDYRIFRRMTRFSWVDSDELSARLGREYGKRGRICTSEQFRTLVRSKSGSLIRQNLNPHGIPQGTPLSGLYANISMLDVDAKLYRYVRSLRGSYRRYSDDIAVVIPGAVDPKIVIAKIEEVLQEVGLHLSSKKTDTSSFSVVGDRIKATKPFQYLGFTFDGERKLIRQSSLTRYYTKMHNGIRAKVRAAKNKGVAREEIYLRELYRRYTHFGKDKNFPRYAYRAARILDAPEIGRQLRNHMGTFRTALKYYLDRAYD
jgi:RNA-directed DNA polymerase